MGHKSKVYETWNKGGHVFLVRFICKKCGFKSKWFNVENTPQPAVEADGDDRYMANNITDPRRYPG